MSRVLKFRAWDKDEKDMFVPSSISSTNCGLWYSRQLKGGINIKHYSEGTSPREVFLMEYTGLNDKNGKEIYEDDIVQYTFDLPKDVYATENGLRIRTAKVFWSDWRSSFAVGNKLSNTDLFRYVRNGNRVEVIGNIYENPELLEGEANE